MYVYVYMWKNTYLNFRNIFGKHTYMSVLVIYEYIRIYTCI